MPEIKDVFEQFAPISTDSLNAFLSKLHPRKLNKGDLLISEGEVCKHLSFIESGALRSYYNRDNKDITISFNTEGEFITAMSSFISQKPTYENIETLTESMVHQISYSDLMPLLESDKELEHLYRLILEQYYISIEELLIFSKFKSAKERYMELLNGNPSIIKYAAVGHIASFLDMSIETLSRIRSSL